MMKKIVSIKRWSKEFFHLKDSPRSLSLGFAIGVIIGFSPTIGFQTLLCLLCAKLLHKNFLALFAGSSIPTGIPCFTPFIYFFCYRMGNLLLGEKLAFSLSQFQRPSISLLSLWKPLLLGCTVAGLVGGFFAYFISLIIIKKVREKRC